MRVPGREQQNSMGDTARELWELTQAYAKQETVDPLKNLGRYLGFGVAGALAIAVGMLLLSLGVLRALQTVDWFDNSWSWAPYALVMTGLIVVIALLTHRIMSPPPGVGGSPPTPGTALRGQPAEPAEAADQVSTDPTSTLEVQ